MTTNQAVGEKVHSLMWRKRISQQALAKALGTTQSSVSKKVHGARPFTLDELMTTATVLGVKPSELLADVNGYACSATGKGRKRSSAKRRVTRSAVAA